MHVSKAYTAVFQLTLLVFKAQMYFYCQKVAIAVITPFYRIADIKSQRQHGGPLVPTFMLGQAKFALKCSSPCLCSSTQARIHAPQG